MGGVGIKALFIIGISKSWEVKLTAILAYGSLNFDLVNLNRLSDAKVDIDNYRGDTGIFGPGYDVIASFNYLANGTTLLTSVVGNELKLSDNIPISGTVKGYADMAIVQGSGTLIWGMIGFDASFAEFGAVIGSTTISDDQILLTKILSGNDVFQLSPYQDKVYGYAGDDTFMGGAGEDFLDGGTGIDKAIFTGAFKQYLTYTSEGFVVDLITNRDGVDTIKNIERLQFSDTNLALDIAPTQNAGSVYMLYKAAFNRAPDEGGIGYWLAQKDTGKNIVTDLAQGFVSSKEFTDNYGTNPTNADYVNKLYQNVLGRSGDAGGVDYWNQELDAGRISKAAVLVQFATLAEGAANVASLIANGIPYTEFVG